MFEKFASNTCKVENEHRENNYKRERERERKKTKNFQKRVEKIITNTVRKHNTEEMRTKYLE